MSSVMTGGRRQIRVRPRPRSGAAARSESLDIVGIASPVLELIMQVRAGIIQPSEEMRATVDGLLRDMEARATEVGHSSEQVQAAKFALASFVDETVLMQDFPLREYWEKNPLQLEYFGEHLAGIKFYERLDAMLKRPEAAVDAIEVYYICLLLGYRGRYAIYFEEQAREVIEKVAEVLRRLGRLQAADLSPHWKQTDQPEIPRDPGLPLWVKLGGGLGVGFVVTVYMLLFYLLGSDVSSALSRPLLR